MDSSRRSPNMNTICYMRKNQCIIQIKQWFRFKWFTCFYNNASTFCNFSWNTFNMFNPNQLLDIGSIYMDGRTTFFFTLGSEYHKFVLSIFRDNLLAFNHSIILLNSLLITSDNSGKFFSLKNKLMSSGNKTENKILHTDAISFIYTKNSNGPYFDPCGTPHVINFISA